MNQFRKFLYLTGIIVLASCGSYKQTDNLGFGGGRCTHMEMMRDRNSKVQLVHKMNDSIFHQNVIGGSTLDSNYDVLLCQKVGNIQSKSNFVNFNKHRFISKYRKSVIDHFSISAPKRFKKKVFELANKKKEFQKYVASQSVMKASHVVSLIIGIIGVLAGFFILLAGGNSSSYIEVAIIGGLVLIFSMILFMYGMYGMCYHRLGTVGKIGFWLTAVGPITVGIGALIGIPLWLIGWIWEV